MCVLWNSQRLFGCQKLVLNVDIIPFWKTNIILFMFNINFSKLRVDQLVE